MNIINSTSFRLTIGWAFGISMFALGGCQSSLTPTVSSQHHEPSPLVEAQSAPEIKLVSATAAMDGINYSPVKTGNITRTTKSDVRGLRGLRGLRGIRGIRGLRGIRGIRGACLQLEDDFALRLLVPQRVGKTLEAQPTLYWWASQALVDTEITFVMDKVPEPDNFEFDSPLIKKTFKVSIPAGIQALPFAKILPADKADFALEQDVEYQWTLLIGCHPDFPSLDIKSTGTITRVAPSAILAKASLSTNSKDLAYLYAEHGIWYDAIDILSSQIQTQPNLRVARANLASQVGLIKVAEYERQ